MHVINRKKKHPTRLNTYIEDGARVISIGRYAECSWNIHEEIKKDSGRFPLGRNGSVRGLDTNLFAR